MDGVGLGGGEDVILLGPRREDGSVSQGGN